MRRLCVTTAAICIALTALQAFAFPKADARRPALDPAVPAPRPGVLSAATITLTWNSRDDMDLHVTGPKVGDKGLKLDGSNRGAPGQAVLETMRGEGRCPEKVTIFMQRAGIYQFYVHDYTEKDWTDTSALSKSGARVELSRDGRTERVFEVPPGRAGNTWSVFALCGDRITPMQAVCDVRDPKMVGRTLRSALLPGDILLGRIPESLVPGAWSHVALYAGDGQVIEAASENENVGARGEADWDYPAMTWVTYLRVMNAGPDVRSKAVDFGRRQVRSDRPYDIRFYSKQLKGGSWYCSELVWAAYKEASCGDIDLEEGPDRLGVYPWEIEASPDVLYVGGHYEREPRRTAKIAWLYVKLVWNHMYAWSGEAWRKMWR